MNASPQDVLARRAQVLARLDALPASADWRRGRLELVTRAFLDTPHFAAAVAIVWDDCELFGCARVVPDLRLAEQGLVSGLALSSLSGPKLETIERDRAIIRCASGSRLVQQRRGLGCPLGRPWFEQPMFAGAFVEPQEARHAA